MRGIIIVYDIDTKKLKRSEVAKFHRKLYGYTDNSQFGKYKYHREGLLDKIPHFIPSRSVIVTKKGYEKEIVKFIKRFTSKVFVREIKLEKEDLRRLK
ncbi:MAG: hypothetical protein ACP5H3_00270 [Candidatus Aenigmatarchaeota archaeon]